jgi:hypothetical protein
VKVGRYSFRAELGDHEAYAHPGVAALFGDRGEGPAYLRALGAGNAAEMKSVVVWDGDIPVAASSLLWFPYDLVSDAPKWHPAINALRKVRSHTAYLRLCGLGGLHTGEPQIVISGKLDADARDAAFLAMIDVAEAEANRRRAHFHYMLDVSREDADAWVGGVLKTRGYFPMEGTPMVWQHLPYATIDEYLASRSQKMRAHFRKKFARARAEIELVETDRVDAALEAEIEALSRSQNANARFKLGGVELQPHGYYSRHAELGKVHVLLYRLRGRTIGFCFMFWEGDVLFAKTMGLTWPEAVDYNLIHYNLFNIISTAIRHGKRWSILGQGGYPTKILLGARLVRRTSFIKGRGIAGPLLPFFASRLDEFNPARAWPEIMEPANYFDADPSGPTPPVKRIWTPDS